MMLFKSLEKSECSSCSALSHTDGSQGNGALLPCLKDKRGWVSSPHCSQAPVASPALRWGPETLAWLQSPTKSVLAASLALPWSACRCVTRVMATCLFEILPKLGYRPPESRRLSPPWFPQYQVPCQAGGNSGNTSGRKRERAKPVQQGWGLCCCVDSLW